ncbi:MAG: YabP/YqfC family sporulation protein [Clostridia bacterium]|nr:YabP/YqfC family sporulation protein [Clostridia bacterium]
MSVFICGIISINAFTEETVSLKSHRARVVISGRDLNVGAYENHTVEVKGLVEDIRFIYGKN